MSVLIIEKKLAPSLLCEKNNKSKQNTLAYTSISVRKIVLKG